MHQNRRISALFQIFPSYRIEFRIAIYCHSAKYWCISGSLPRCADLCSEGVRTAGYSPHMPVRVWKLQIGRFRTLPRSREAGEHRRHSKVGTAQLRLTTRRLNC